VKRWLCVGWVECVGLRIKVVRCVVRVLCGYKIVWKRIKNIMFIKLIDDSDA
jgi:hypothetical protein